jgi:DNA-3-methyladenine glycosylase II
VPAWNFELEPRGPFSLASANAYFGGWAAMGADQQRIVMAFPVEGWQTAAAVVIHQAEDSTVHAEVHLANPEDDAPAAEAAWQQAQAALSLDYDGSGFEQVGQCDPVIGRLQQDFSKLRPVCFHSPYEAAAAFIISHRSSMAQARTLRTRLAREHGQAIQIGEHTFHAFPRPQRLLDLTSYGPIAGEKMERLHAIAEAALAGTLDRQRLRQLPVTEALRELRMLRGVGPFMAQGILLRGAGLVDEVPDDEVTRQAVQHAYDLPTLPTHPQVLERAEAWRPYRMWACVLLHVWLRRSGRSFRATGRAPSVKKR